MSPALQTDEGGGRKEHPEHKRLVPLCASSKLGASPRYAGTQPSNKSEKTAVTEPCRVAGHWHRPKGTPGYSRCPHSPKGNSPLFALTNTSRSTSPSQFGKLVHPCAMVGRGASNETLVLTTLSVNLQGHHLWPWQRTGMTEGKGVQWSSHTHLMRSVRVRSLLAFAQEHPKIPQCWGSTQQAGREEQPQVERQRHGVGRLEQAAAQTGCSAHSQLSRGTTTTDTKPTTSTEDSCL